jgi:multicomponent Na+:H+ antiporter subunit D
MPELLPAMLPAMLMVPAFAMLLGAALVAVTRGAVRGAVALATPLVALAAIWQVPDGAQVMGQFLGYPIELVHGSSLRRLFATVFALMAFGGVLFAFRQARWWELTAALAYAAGAIGVSFAGDLIVLFLFWELMALSSVVIVWCGGTFRSKRAGIRYLILHVLGGIVLKIGIEGVMVHTGSIEIRPLLLDNVHSWLVLAGVLVTAAAPPVSAWLADAYPESSPTGSVFLSAFTTKTAVLALMLLFPGEPLLIWIGLWMVFYGIIYALLENDIRRILAYSIVNQVGFMVVAVGIGTELALNGAAAHAFAHVFYMALLFMTAGAVIQQTGRRKYSELGGLFRSMPVTTACAIVGALAIAAFPLTSGFIAKSLTLAGAADAGLGFVWFMLLAASAGVLLHVGLKYPWFVFFHEDSGLRPLDPPWNMRAAMLLFAGVSLMLGLFPGLLYGFLPYPVEYAPYRAEPVVSQLQLLLFAGLAFFLMLPLLRRTPTVTLDFDWFWRVAWVEAFRFGERLLGAARRWLGDGVRMVMQRLSNELMRHHGAQGILARAWPTGSMLLWVAVLLAVFMIARYA